MVSMMKVKARNIGVGDRQYFWWLTRKLEIVEEILQLELLECRRIFTEVLRGDGQKILLQDVAKRVRNDQMMDQLESLEKVSAEILELAEIFKEVKARNVREGRH